MLEAMQRTKSLIRNGPLWLTASALSFAVMAVVVRIAGGHGIPGSETTLIRFLFGIGTVGILHASGTARVVIRRIPLLSARGILGGIAILLYFLSLSAARGPGATPLTNSVFLGNSYFIYVPLFGALLIGERLCLSTAIAVVSALGGLYLVAQPDLAHIRAGDAYGFFAGIISGIAIVTVRELRKTEPSVSIFLSLCVFGSLVALMGMILEKPIWPDLVGWGLLIAMGITSAAGQLFMTYAFKYTRAGPGGIIQMTTVIYSSFAGILWFGDPFNGRILIGALIVLASAAYISLQVPEACERNVYTLPH